VRDLYTAVEELRVEIDRHGAQTMSQQGFRTNVRTACKRWQLVKHIVDDARRRESLNQAFETLLELSSKPGAPTRAYRDAIVKAANALVPLVPLSRSPFEQVLDTLELHPLIRGVAERLFADGHYAQAVFEAFKALDAFIREKTGLRATGYSLMKHAFGGDRPILRLNELANRSDKNEQRGYMLLFEDPLCVLSGMQVAVCRLD